MITVLFLGSKPIGFNCLKYLIENRNILNINIIGVLSNNNASFGSEFSLKRLASENFINFYESLQEIESFKVDYLVSVQYHLILRQKHIDIARILAFNLHMAPLPELRGCNQFSFAIYNNFKTFGTTIHKIEDGIDNGDIIFERRFDIPDNCLVNELYELTDSESLKLFIEKIHSILNGNYSLQPQEQLVEIRGTSLNYRKDILKLKTIDFNEGIEEVTKKVKATAMPGFEPPFYLYEGSKYYIIPEKNYKINK